MVQPELLEFDLRGILMISDPTVSLSVNEGGLRRTVGFIADGIVRARYTSKQREVKLRNWYIGVSVIFSLLGTAGLVKTKVDALPADQMSWAFVVAIISLIVVIVLELYRAFGVEETALRLLAAKEAYSLLEVDAKHALEEDNPLPSLELVRSQSHSLEKMFHQVLPPTREDEVTALVESLVKAYRPEGGWCLPVSQQKPKQRRGEA
jgi:hypothetical protein